MAPDATADSGGVATLPRPDVSTTSPPAIRSAVTNMKRLKNKKGERRRSDVTEARTEVEESVTDSSVPHSVLGHVTPSGHNRVRRLAMAPSLGGYHEKSF